MRHLPRRSDRSTMRAGFSLIEVTISSLLVGTLLVASTRSVGLSVLSQCKMADFAKATWMADALVGEMHQQSYMEPATTISPITRESGESGGSRANWDDFDDYDGLSESPPQNKDGTTIANLTGWQRTVAVQWVTLNDINSTSVIETGVKKAVITVKLNGTTIITRFIIRTKGS